MERYCSYFKIQYFEKIKINKAADKLYLQNKVCKSSKAVVISLTPDSYHNKEIPIKKLRTKSIVLKEPVKSGELVMVAYETWKWCECVMTKADDLPLDGDDGVYTLNVSV